MTAITIKQLTQHLESHAPLAYQESYDNAGLITGHPEMEISGVLVSLDCTEEVVDEAIAKGCNVVVAHHPIVFSGLKKLNGKNYVERTVIKAIKHDVAIYAIHTNLDNVATGVNSEICKRIGLQHTQILAPKSGLLKKIVVYVPKSYLEVVQEAMFSAGAGKIGHYSECSFYSEGTGTFKGGEQANPFVGDKGARHLEPEYRLEVQVEEAKVASVLKAMQQVHPYEEVAYDVFETMNVHAGIGSGMIGELPEALSAEAFLQHLKQTMGVQVVRYTPVTGMIKKVAVCGGAGSFLVKQAMGAGAHAYVTADMKYHEFFDAEGRLMIADIGHYESEIFTIHLLSEVILKKFHTFAVILSEIQTNPINYYY